MPAQSPRRRKTAVTSSSRTVKCTVLLRVETHARLAAAAALRGCDRSTFAAECIEAGLKGVVIIDRRKLADSGELPGEEIGGGTAA